MMDQSKNIEDTDTEPKIEAKEQPSVQNTKRKLRSKVLLVGTIISIFMIFSFASWSFYEHFMKRANAIQEANYYVPIPEIVVNLRSVNTKGNILRTNLSLQVYHKEDEVKIKEFMPVILDQILSYLRDQSVGDLEGPGLDRMREAILLRINNIVRPIKIHRIVLRDFIIQ